MAPPANSITGLKPSDGGLRTEQRAGKLVLMQGTEIHKCRRKKIPVFLTKNES